MFSQAFAGVYGDKVHWFAGVADGVVHITLHDNDRDNVVYDFRNQVDDNVINEMCEDYIKRYIDVPQLTSGENE